MTSTGRPRLLDLFCGAGGAALGYSRAGFEVVGVDIKPQPNYPFTFHQGDALEFLAAHGSEYDAIHASPPCQGYSIMNNLPWLRGRDYPLLILPVLEMLEALGKPYMIENVMGARHGAKGLAKRGIEAHGLKAGWLCGGMFGLPFYRHRLFATNWAWFQPGHPMHQRRILAGRARDIVFPPVGKSRGQRQGMNRGLDGHLSLTPPLCESTLTNWRNGNGAQANGVGVGHAKGWQLAAEMMGIDWMKRAELTQAIPPVYTEFIATVLIRELPHDQ